MDDKTTYYQKKREKKLLNRSKEYYKNNKDRIRDQTRNKYRQLSDDKESIKGEYGKNRCQNMLNEDKKA